MATIVWTESIPSGTSLVGNAPTDLPRIWKAVSSGMATEHFWSGVGGASDESCGELLPGAARCYIQNEQASISLATTSQATGRLAFLDSSSSFSVPPMRLFGYDSAITVLLGSKWFDEHVQSSGTGYWLRQSGSITGISTGTGTNGATFSVAYIGIPTVFVSSSNFSWYLSVASRSSSGFSSTYSSRAGAAGTAILYWESLGTVGTDSY